MRPGLWLPLGALLLGACAGTPRQPGPRDYGLVPSRLAAAATVAAPEPTAIAPLPGPEDLLVSQPAPAESTPLAELANVFDRMRLGYALPEIANRSIDLQARYFVGNAEFLDRSFERAERYLYYIVRELESRQMPLELALLPVIESAYNPYAYSRARAAGIWQFIAPTATRHQVRVNWWQDGRRDVVDSTRAALDYLSELHTQFNGDWLLAIAAYNCGEQGVERALARARAAHKPTDFFHLKLPRETRGYVPKLLALARIVADPERYGLEFAAVANKPYFAQVEVGTQVDLRLAAALLGITEDDLHALNPAFNRWATDPEGPHHLLVPAESAAEFARTIAALTPEFRMPLEHYHVQDGDTLVKLAEARDLPVPAIRRLNGLGPGDFVAGADILLPATKVEPLKAGLIIEGETPLPGHRRHSYVVRRGDTLASIARRNGVNVRELAELNELEPATALKAGSRLLVDTRERHRVRKRKHKTANG